MRADEEYLMHRNAIKGLLATGLAAALVLGGAATSASAVTLSYSYLTATCQLNATSGAYTAVASNTSCNRVRAKLTYISSGGTTYTVTSALNLWTATATAATTMITSRAAEGTIVVSDVERFPGYKSF
jgi:hypothetical protein